jgi:hypothetical protein
MDPVFGTFIAKLFQDSFRTNVVKQNFRLTFDRKLITLVQLVYRHVGIGAFSEVVGSRFNVFNSSSFCANLLENLISSWDPNIIPKVKRSYNSLYSIVIKRILSRIALRRSDSDVAYVGQAGKRFSKANKELIRQYPLRPFETQISVENKRTHKHLDRKFRGVSSLPLEAITRSSITEHEKYTIEMMGYGSIRSPVLKNVH